MGKLKEHARGKKEAKAEFSLARHVLVLNLVCNSYEKIGAKTFIGLGRYVMVESCKAQGKGVGFEVLESGQKNLKDCPPIFLEAISGRCQLKFLTREVKGVLTVQSFLRCIPEAQIQKFRWLLWTLVEKI